MFSSLPSTYYLVDSGLDWFINFLAIFKFQISELEIILFIHLFSIFSSFMFFSLKVVYQNYFCMKKVCWLWLCLYIKNARYCSASTSFYCNWFVSSHMHVLVLLFEPSFRVNEIELLFHDFLWRLLRDTYYIFSDNHHNWDHKTFSSNWKKMPGEKVN